MMRHMLKSKIHRATVTDVQIDYEGSIAIDEKLMREADILPHEQVAIYNITNGNRFMTYAIVAAPGRGEICVNGAAAHKCKKGDLIIIVTYTQMETEKARQYQPIVVRVDSRNRMQKLRTQNAA